MWPYQANAEGSLVPNPALPADGATDPSDSTQHVSRLNRILKQAASEGTESDVVCAFVEALAVWHDVESWGYAPNLSGQLVRDVSLPGSEYGAAPTVIAADQVATERSAGGIVRLSPERREALGFTPSQDLVFLSIHPRAASPWLLAISHPEYCDDARLGAYGATLSEALDELAGVESSRATWAMLQQLLPGTRSLTQAADRAVHELSIVLRHPAGLVVQTGDGRLLVASGEAADDVMAPHAHTLGELLSVPVDPSLPFRARLVARGTASRPLRARDERLLRAAAAPLAAWLRTVGGRVAPMHERRSGARSFEDIIAQHDLTAARLHQDVSMIIVAVTADARRHDQTQAWVGHIRQQLRPSDLAGQLTGGDIGILLPRTAAADARVVMDRLRRLIHAHERFAPLRNAAIGIATSPGDGQPHPPLLAAAYPTLQ
jgi:hypothetical protein